ncbi:MAG: PRC-barrel domain containing protein [Oscillochloris sp.]|nr:PRC-barrel domain containing protein [Oscillochloris sp.]
MLRDISDIRGLKIRATDDEIGRVNEFFFDDEHWTIRYMVVNTGNWLLGNSVLISPRSIQAIDWNNRRVEVNLTRQQVKDAPNIVTSQPVSRQMELAHASYYNYEPYWAGPGLWGGTSVPFAASYSSLPMAATEREFESYQSPSDSHLRSTDEVADYHICAIDGEIGHVDDFIMDDASWTMRYVVIDTRNWWPGKRVLIAPDWISEVNWNDRTVDVDLAYNAIKSAPEYKSGQISREYEDSLYRYYQRPIYWGEEG